MSLIPHPYRATEDFEHSILRLDALGQVRVHLFLPDDVVPRTLEALRMFFSTLHRDDETTRYEETFYWGGYSLGVNWRGNALPEITLESAGEDAVSSLEAGAERLGEVVRAVCSQARLEYEELPLTHTHFGGTGRSELGR